MEEAKEDVLNLPQEEPELTEMISINVICRLCANQNDKLIGIYSEDGINNDLANKMNLYLPVKVAEADELPLQCCWQCASTVLAWHDLVVTSVEADRRLRNCEFVTTKPIDVEFEPVKNNSSMEEADEEHNEEEIDHPVPVSLSLNAFCQNVSVPDPLAVNLNIKKDLTCEPSAMQAYSGSSDDQQQKYFKSDSSDNEDHKDIIQNYEEEFLDAPNDEDDLEQPIYNFGCQSCSAMFFTKEEIVKHIQESHENVTVASTVVNAATGSKKEGRKNNKIDQDLVNAAKVVVNGRIYYNCKQCGKSLHSPYTYVWHMRIHTGERPFVCDLCGKQFRVSQGLVRHLKETHERIKNFPCDLCGRMFATRRNVEEHRRIHTNERPYICDLCGKAFKQKASLFVHNRSHTDLFPFKCTYCTQAFRTKPPLLIHITRHTGEKPYPCDICGRCFRIKYELKRHRLIHSDEKPFSCEGCGLCFRQKRLLFKLNQEYVTVPEEQCDSPPPLESDSEENDENTSSQYTCIKCKKNFENSQDLNNHQKKHKETTNTVLNYLECIDLETKTCNLCDTSFKTKLQLRKHMKDTHNLTEQRHRRKKSEIQSQFFCHVCNKGFTRKFDMQKHLSVKHPDEKSLEAKKSPNLEVIKACKIVNDEGGAHYKCDSCDKVFKRSYSLVRHRTVHSGVRSYCCHICGKRFRVSNGLVRHINEHHHKVKKYACDVCGVKFVSRHTRDEHLNIHTNNRPFICDVCGKSFKQSASLHIHKLFHSNVFRFQCNACGKKFRRAQDLKVHKWIHTGEKPYKCVVCSTNFRLSQDLKRHMKVHDKPRECVCAVCGSQFSQDRYLKIHQKIHLPLVVDRNMS